MRVMYHALNMIISVFPFRKVQSNSALRPWEKKALKISSKLYQLKTDNPLIRTLPRAPRVSVLTRFDLILKNASLTIKYGKSDLWFDCITLAEFALLSTLTLIYRGTGDQNVQNFAM